MLWHSLCGAESIEQRTAIEIHLGRLLQNRIWGPVAVGLAIPSLLVARFIFQQGSPPVWPRYSWQFFAWPLYGLTATVNRPANLVISISVSILFASLLFYSISRANNGNSSLRNGLFYAIAATSVLYVAAPYTMSGGTVVNPRFLLFSVLLVILLFATLRVSHRFWTAGRNAVGLSWEIQPTLFRNHEVMLGSILTLEWWRR